MLLGVQIPGINLWLEGGGGGKGQEWAYYLNQDCIMRVAFQDKSNGILYSNADSFKKWNKLFPMCAPSIIVLVIKKAPKIQIQVHQN